jgi:DNA modification methylase
VRPAVEVGGARVFLGDCRDVLRTLPDNSVDSIVTDPPYELGFMGKKWDSSGIAYDVTVWQECLRVLKPGGHVLAFGGSRTWHRLAVAVEDAGFEIRDSIAWLSNKTFPKSLDISKAIDKTNGEGGRKLKFTRWMRTTGLTARQIDALTGTNMGGHYLTNKSQPAIPTTELWALLRPHCGDVPEWVDELVERVEAEREVIGQRTGAQADSTGRYGAWGNDNGKGVSEFDETAPATSEAKQWQGWGTALKPCFEPVVMGRKPLDGTVAENVLQWGVGGLNIDGSRIGTDLMIREAGPSGIPSGAGNYVGSVKPRPHLERLENRGRWPANACVDEATSEELGDNSRFFFVGKTTKADRSEGVDGENFHPTVKPTELMRYLIKLITPAGGTVLDPFTGSGSTGKAALLDGYCFVGAELTAEYLPIIESRLRWATEKVENDDTLF